MPLSKSFFFFGVLHSRVKTHVLPPSLELYDISDMELETRFSVVRPSISKISCSISLSCHQRNHCTRERKRERDVGNSMQYRFSLNGGGRCLKLHRRSCVESMIGCWCHGENSRITELEEYSVSRYEIC